MEALGAFETAERIELLIIRPTFPEGTPNGVSLARMARMKKRGVQVLFVGRDENREHTEGVGEFMAMPLTAAELVAEAERLLAQAALS